MNGLKNAVGSMVSMSGHIAEQMDRRTLKAVRNGASPTVSFGRLLLSLGLVSIPSHQTRLSQSLERLIQANKVACVGGEYHAVSGDAARRVTSAR